MARRKTRRGQLADVESRPRGALRLALVLAVLVGINLYVFVWRSGTSVPDVMERAAVAGSDGEPAPGAPGADPGATPNVRVATAELEAAGGVVEPIPAPDRWVDGEVQRGDSLGGILQREGLTPPEADELIRTLRPVLDMRKIRAGQRYRMRFAAQGTLLEFEFQVSKILQVRAERGADGALVAKKLEARTDTRFVEVAGRIDSSLWHSIKDSGEDASLVSFFVDVFAYDINFFIDTQAGDTFKMVVEKVYLEDEFLHYGKVRAAEYHGKVGTFRAFWWHVPGADEGEYYNEDGRATAKTFLKTPLKFSRVSSKFNPKRMHPILHRVKGHMGTDFAAPTGTPVWAAASGKIVYRGPRGGAGNCVIVKHDNGYQTIYMHLNKFKSGQRVGQYVKQKTVIGYVGMTGLATGPHLHFGVKQNGRYVDPQRIKMTPGPPVPKRHLDQFKRETRELVAELEAIQVPIAVAGDPTRAALPN